MAGGEEAWEASQPKPKPHGKTETPKTRSRRASSSARLLADDKRAASGSKQSIQRAKKLRHKVIRLQKERVILDDLFKTTLELLELEDGADTMGPQECSMCTERLKKQLADYKRTRAVLNWVSVKEAAEDHEQMMVEEAHKQKQTTAAAPPTFQEKIQEERPQRNENQQPAPQPAPNRKGCFACFFMRMRVDA